MQASSQSAVVATLAQVGMGAALPWQALGLGAGEYVEHVGVVVRASGGHLRPASGCLGAVLPGRHGGYAIEGGHV